MGYRPGRKTKLPLRGLPGSPVSSWLNFTPASLPGVIGWWDASDDSTFTFSSGTDVAQWNSKVGSSALTQGTSLKQPSRSGSVNGLASVVFDGSSDSMSTSTTFDMTGDQRFSVWFVGTCVSGGGDRVFVEQLANYSNSAGAFILFRNGANKIEFIKHGGSGISYAQFITLTDLTTTPKAFVGTHDGTLTTNETSGWLNLDTAGTRTFNANTNANNLNQNLFVGARNNASLFLNGSICEFGICTTALTQNQVEVLTQYLRYKWAVQF